MRQVRRNLEKFFKLLRSDLIAHQRKSDGQRKRNQDRVKTDYDRIADGKTKLIRIKVLNKVLQSYPFASKNTICGSKILKRNDYSIHWIVGEQQKNDNRWKHQQIQCFAFFYPG